MLSDKKEHISEEMRQLNALQYLVTEIGPVLICPVPKGRKALHEKDERAYRLVMDLIKRLRRENAEEYERTRTLDF